jgi:anti-sigma factor RsiW
MNECQAIQAKFTEYLDGRLGGREMQRIGAHLERCRDCGDEWISLKHAQSLLANLGPVLPPEDLSSRIRTTIRQELIQRRQGPFHGWNLIWKESLGPFLFQLSTGFASAVLLMGTVILMVGMFAQPESARASTDEPLGMTSQPHLLYLSSSAGKHTIEDVSGPVVIEAYVNGAGRVYDYRIVSGQTDDATRSQVENLLLWSVFEPARRFGEPVRGLAVLSFSGVSVQG